VAGPSIRLVVRWPEIAPAGAYARCMAAGRGPAPRIVVTLLDPTRQADPASAARKNALCVDSVVRHGAVAIPLDATASERDRAGAFASMDGLLLTGGADLDPARYGAASVGTRDIDAARDELEATAWAAADRRGLPVFGICRGFQAMNVFAGGTLLQHVEGHAGPGYGTGPALTHPLRIVAGTKLARILFPANVGGGVVAVNSYHHQALRHADLAPGFVACGLSPSPAGELVEAIEAPTGPFRMGVQSHPERTDSTPRQFERLFAFFVDACRGPLRGR
jgi:putative glutamine amidotransferase